MDENQNQTSEQGEPDAPGGRAQELADRLRAVGVDPAKMEELKRKLAAMSKSNETTHSGSEKPSDVPEQQPGELDVTAGKRFLTGADVDWDEYNIDFNLLHLYKKAHHRPTPEGMKWVVTVVDFLSVSREFNKHGQSVNAVNGTGKEPLNLGEYLKDVVNGKDQWRIAAVLPGPNGQCGLLLEREVPIVLPEPEPLKKKEEVDAPTDPELTAVEDAALNFMAEQKEVDNEPVVEHTTSGPVGLRAIEKGSDEDLQIRETLEDGALRPATPQKRVAVALERNAQFTVEAPQGKGLQPEAVEGNPFAVSAANPEGKVPAAGPSAAADLLRALTDPQYRASLPRED